jgi:hypothetical protein
MPPDGGEKRCRPADYVAGGNKKGGSRPPFLG